MSKHPETDLYRIYLLTVTYSCAGNQQWRFLLEDPRSGKRRGFTNIEELVEGLLDAVVPHTPSLDDSESSASAPSPGC